VVSGTSAQFLPSRTARVFFTRYPCLISPWTLAGSSRVFSWWPKLLVMKKTHTAKLAPLGSLAHRVDTFCEGIVSPLRGNQGVDRLAWVASAAGDHGAVWAVLSALWAIGKPQKAPAILRALGLAGVGSLCLDGLAKFAGPRLLPRSRPRRVPGDPPLPRRPRGNSFPSGHSTAAGSVVVLLGTADPLLGAVCVPLAATIAWSRIHLKAHHASDVIGGLVIGAGVGLVLRPLVPPRQEATESDERASQSRTSAPGIRQQPQGEGQFEGLHLVQGNG